MVQGCLLNSCPRIRYGGELFQYGMVASRGLSFTEVVIWESVINQSKQRILSPALLAVQNWMRTKLAAYLTTYWGIQYFSIVHKLVAGQHFHLSVPMRNK